MMTMHLSSAFVYLLCREILEEKISILQLVAHVLSIVFVTARPEMESSLLERRNEIFNWTVEAPECHDIYRPFKACSFGMADYRQEQCSTSCEE
jgi:hypothetical protein